MNPPLLSPYHQELSEFRLAYSKAGAIVSIVLVLMGLGLHEVLRIWPALTPIPSAAIGEPSGVAFCACTAASSFCFSTSPRN